VFDAAGSEIRDEICKVTLSFAKAPQMIRELFIVAERYVHFTIHANERELLIVAAKLL